MYCDECGAENEDNAVFCKNCNAVLATESRQGLSSYSDPAVGLLIISIGVIIGLAAILPFFLLETKEKAFIRGDKGGCE